MAVKHSSLRTIRAAILDEWERRGRRRALVLCAAVGMLAIVVVLGHLLQVRWMVSPDGTPNVTKVLSAVMAGLLALAVMSLRPLARDLLTLISAAIAVVVIAEWLTGRSLGIDQLLIDDPFASANPGRPSGVSATGMLLLSGAAVLVPRGHVRTGGVLAGVAAALGAVLVYAHLYDAQAIYRPGSPFSAGLISAVFMVLLATAVLMVVPHGALQWVSYGTDPGASLLRLIAPIPLVGIPLVGWLGIEGQRRGVLDGGVAAALLMTLVAGSILALTYRAGRVAQRIDGEREKLVEEMNQVNQQLEERVRVRSVQINRQRTRLALLEERDRIARDLHDRVIQRIFAAGLQVAALGRTARRLEKEYGEDSHLGESLNSVARELDMAIRELRNSIFELTSIADHQDIEQVLHDIASRSSRILGFMPRVEAEGSVVGMPPDLVAQVASVIQEALSNIARHARASSVMVSLVATPDSLTVRVSDDGVGLPDPLPRSSGISNLMNRARNLGGTATWTANDPRGTVMTWQVPRSPSDELAAPAEELVTDGPLG